MKTGCDDGARLRRQRDELPAPRASDTANDADHRAARDARPAAGLADAPAEAGVQQEADERQERDQQQHPRNPRYRLSVAIRLTISARERVGVERLPVPEQRDDDREADRRFGGGDGHDEEHDDLAVGRCRARGRTRRTSG